MEKQIATQLNKNFEKIKKVDENGVEYWEARELMFLLGYNRWENFENVIKKAKEACFSSGQEEADHFRDATKMV
jgi:DNA-damage-inducible protein D